MQKTNQLARVENRNTAIAATLFLFPAIALIIVYMVYPIIDTFLTSRYSWNGISTDKVLVGLENWKTLIHDSKFWSAFGHNVIVMVFSILLQIPIGMLLATFLDAGGRKLNIFKVIWFLPYLMSSVAIAFLFTYILATNGGLFSILLQIPIGMLLATFLDAGGRKLNIFKIIWFLPYLMSSVAIAFLFTYILATNGGLFSTIATMLNGKRTAVDLLGKSPQALYAVIGVMAWQFTPFYMVYFIAGYSNIPTSLYEAAVIDGANRRQYLFKIAIPMLGPIFKTACTMSMIGSLKYFDMIWNMTQGGPAGGTELMATYMYKLSFQQWKMGYGSAVAAGMFILITAIALLFQKIFVVKEDF